MIVQDTDPTVCPKDGALLREDTDFLRAAREEGVDVRRLVGICGHSLYLGPAVEARGWRPRPAGETRCDKCGTVLPGVHKTAHGAGVRRCRACRGLPATCIGCGRTMKASDPRKTCGAVCLSRLAAETPGPIAVSPARSSGRRRSTS